MEKNNISTKCLYCEDPHCSLTKDEILKRGPIIEGNAHSILRDETEEYPRTYAFKGVPAYDSLSALIPDPDDENPHAYMRFRYDEDEDCAKGWECCEVQNPLNYQTEEEILIDLLREKEKNKIDMQDFDFLTSANGRALFCKNNEKGLYSGVNEDGEKVFVLVDKNGIIVKTQRKEKPKWLEVQEYDEDGFLEGESYEPFDE